MSHEADAVKFFKENLSGFEALLEAEKFVTKENSPELTSLVKAVRVIADPKPGDTLKQEGIEAVYHTDATLFTLSGKFQILKTAEDPNVRSMAEQAVVLSDELYMASQRLDGMLGNAALPYRETPFTLAEKQRYAPDENGIPTRVRLPEPDAGSIKLMSPEQMTRLVENIHNKGGIGAGAWRETMESIETGLNEAVSRVQNYNRDTVEAIAQPVIGPVAEAARSGAEMGVRDGIQDTLNTALQPIAAALGEVKAQVGEGNLALRNEMTEATRHALTEMTTMMRARQIWIEGGIETLAKETAATNEASRDALAAAAGAVDESRRQLSDTGKTLVEEVAGIRQDIHTGLGQTAADIKTHLDETQAAVTANTNSASEIAAIRTEIQEWRNETQRCEQARTNLVRAGGAGALVAAIAASSAFLGARLGVQSNAQEHSGSAHGSHSPYDNPQGFANHSLAYGGEALVRTQDGATILIPKSGARDALIKTGRTPSQVVIAANEATGLSGSIGIDAPKGSDTSLAIEAKTLRDFTLSAPTKTSLMFSPKSGVDAPGFTIHGAHIREFAVVENGLTIAAVSPFTKPSTPDQKAEMLERQAEKVNDNPVNYQMREMAKRSSSPGPER